MGLFWAGSNIFLWPNLTQYGPYRTRTTWPQPGHAYTIYRPIGLLPYNVQLQSAWANWRWTIFTKTISEEVCSNWHSNSLFRYFCRSKFVTFWSSLNLLITFTMVHYAWLVQHLYPNSGHTSCCFYQQKFHEFDAKGSPGKSGTNEKTDSGAYGWDSASYFMGGKPHNMYI